VGRTPIVSTRKLYPHEYKREAVKLYRLGGTTYAAVGRKLGVSGETLRDWGRGRL
jgi:transposase-like protein